MFVSTKKYEDLLKKLEEVSSESDKYKKKYSKLKEDTDAAVNKLQVENKKLFDENSSLKGEVTKLKKVESESNEVKLTFSDDLKEITPFVRYKADVIPSKLKELGYIAEENDKFNAQIGLMLVAKEGLDQILSKFEQPIEN